jgi:hypothetical protein
MKRSACWYLIFFVEDTPDSAVRLWQQIDPGTRSSTSCSAKSWESAGGTRRNQRSEQDEGPASQCFQRESGPSWWR